MHMMRNPWRGANGGERKGVNIIHYGQTFSFAYLCERVCFPLCLAYVYILVLTTAVRGIKPLHPNQLCSVFWIKGLHVFDCSNAVCTHQG